MFPILLFIWTKHAFHSSVPCQYAINSVSIASLLKIPFVLWILTPPSGPRPTGSFFLHEDLDAETGGWLPHIHPTLLEQDLQKARDTRAGGHISQISSQLGCHMRPSFYPSHWTLCKTELRPRHASTGKHSTRGIWFYSKGVWSLASWGSGGHVRVIHCVSKDHSWGNRILLPTVAAVAFQGPDFLVAEGQQLPQWASSATFCDLFPETLPAACSSTPSNTFANNLTPYLKSLSV